MSNIPQAGARLLKVIKLLEPIEGTAFARSELMAIYGLLKREPAVRKAARVKVVTDAMIDKVLACAKANPKMGFHEIAELTGVDNIGRVSEIVTGKRKKSGGGMF